MPVWWNYERYLTPKLQLAHVVYYEALHYYNLLYELIMQFYTCISVWKSSILPNYYEHELCGIKRNLCCYNVCKALTLPSVNFSLASQYFGPFEYSRIILLQAVLNEWKLVDFISQCIFHDVSGVKRKLTPLNKIPTRYEILVLWYNLISFKNDRKTVALQRGFLRDLRYLN